MNNKLNKIVMLSTELYEFNQIRLMLPSEATGFLDNVVISIEYQKENLKKVEVWVRIDGDKIKGYINYVEAKNKDMKSESFHQDLITQVNKMPNIDAIINAWIWKRQNE